MNTLLKSFVIRSPLYGMLRSIAQRKELRTWEKTVRSGPLPQLLKEGILRSYADEFGLNTLVETGTYLGDMVFALKDSFDEIYTIELDSYLYKRAKRRFSKYGHIHVLQGDSGEVLPGILASLDKTKRVLFWLDAHYCGGITSRTEIETPVVKELEWILTHFDCHYAIMVDDARCFAGKDGYPTISDVVTLVSAKCPTTVAEIENDIIRIHPKL
jgi:hypothetical protein